jgi:hypothetical protein
MGRAYWKMVADKISRDSWCWGMSEAMVNSRKTFVVDAHRGYLLPRSVVRADTLLGALGTIPS